MRDWLGGEEAGAFAVSARDGAKLLAEGCFRQFSADPRVFMGIEKHFSD